MWHTWHFELLLCLRMISFIKNLIGIQSTYLNIFLNLPMNHSNSAISFTFLIRTVLLHCRDRHHWVNQRGMGTFRYHGTTTSTILTINWVQNTLYNRQSHNITDPRNSVGLLRRRGKFYRSDGVFDYPLRWLPKPSLIFVYWIVKC